MFPVSPLSSKFNSLAQRPPTPPRDLLVGVDDALRFLQNGHDENLLETPQSSAAISEKAAELESPAPAQISESITSKKVGFLTQPIYHPSPDSVLSHTSDASPARHIPRTHSGRPLKSILKQSIGHPPPSPADLDNLLNCFSPQEPGSFRKMLNSALQHLAQPSRSARLDAYLALNGALKTYDSIPDPDAMLDKSSLLLQFIARDVAWKDATGRLDRDIVTQALYLTNSMIFNARTAPALDEEFRIFILDRSITALEQPDTPKGVTKGYLVLLCHSRLYAGIISANRAERLLTALHTITDRCSGNSIVGARLIVYHRLLEQAPTTMLTKMRDWLEDTFHSLLSTNKEHRARALETCTATGLILGTHPNTAKALDELLGRTGDETNGGETYGDYVIQKLRQMVSDGESATYVPQVWAAVVLLLRSKRRPLDRWLYFRKWLETLQQCLNSSDINVRQQAHIAWNKLAFSAMPDSSHTESFRSMLKLPIVVGLKVRGREKRAQQQRSLAMDSYCNLLHYAMRPGLSHEDMDKAWDLYVDEVLSSMAQSSPKGQQYACSILQGLFQKKEGAWNANAANETRAIKPSELPRLDPKWLRSRFGRIVRLVEPLIKTAMTSPEASYAAMQFSWHSLLSAIAEAGSQEVRTSNELKDVLAQLLNMLRRVWRTNTDLNTDTDASIWLERYHNIIRDTFDSLGPGHFVQDFLLTSSNDEVEATPTPSSRISKHSTPSDSAVMYLFALYCQPSDLICRSEKFVHSVAGLLTMTATTKTSVPEALAMMQRLLQFSVKTTCLIEKSEIHALIWTAIATRTTEILQAQSSTTPTRDASDTGAALRAALHIMQHGMPFYNSTFDSSDAMASLYTAMCKSALRLGGPGCLVIGIMEPVARFALEISDDLSIDGVTKLAQMLVLEGKWPKNRQALEDGRKILRGHSLDTTSNSSFEPFDLTYVFLQKALLRLYNQSSDTAPSLGLLSAYTAFVKASPTVLLAKVLARTQVGLIAFVEDRQRYFSSARQGGLDSSDVLLEQWRALLNSMRTIPRKDSLLLQSIESLLTGGLSSTIQAVANETIIFWNETFGKEDTLTYPSQLEAVLYARSREVEISLPAFREDIHNIPTIDLPVFEQAHDGRIDFGDFPTATVAPRLVSLLLNPERENTLIKQHLAQNALIHRSNDRPLPSRSTSSNPVPRFLHNDSQIDFAYIEPQSQHSDDDNHSLTDHQIEVQTRQMEDAQIYPTMSSSPVMSPRKGLPKRLDIIAQSLRMQNPELLATPDELVDGNPMSDDLPSSPTPRATSRKFVDAEFEDEDDHDVMSDTELTSSPPRQSERARLNRDIATAALADMKDVDITIEDDVADSSEVVCEVEDEAGLDTPQEQWTDLPSDTYLPSVQLLREEAAAKSTAVTYDHAGHAVQEVVDPNQPHAGHTCTSESTQEDEQCGDIENLTDSSQMLLNSAEVDDERGPSDSVEAEDQKDAGSRSHRASRKRKRASGTVYTARKRKPQSPLKKLFSNLFGQSQEEEEDEDIGDEIIVASSQSLARPNITAPQPAVLSAEPEKESSMDQTTDSVASVPATQVKRGRGRPRRSLEALPPSTSKTNLKRNASAAGLDETDESRTVKGRKQHSEQESARTDQSQVSRDARRSARVTRRSSAVARDSCHNETTPDAEAEPASDEQPSQESVTSSMGTSGRKIAQPTSILGRLRGILADCRDMIMGSQEQREIDSVLSEMRREVLDAGRRGRTP